MNDCTQDHRDAACGQDRLGRLAYSVAEAATVTGLGKTTLYSLIAAGTLPSRKIGKRRLIASSDLSGLIGGNRNAAS